MIMNLKEMCENKVYRSIRRYLAEIISINQYHGKEDIERSVRIINACKKRAQERIDNGADEASVNEWLERTISCFKTNEGGYTYEEISNYWRTKVNKLKADAEEQLMQKALLLQRLSMNEKNPQKSIAISKDCTKYMEAVVYIAENINYNA